MADATLESLKASQIPDSVIFYHLRLDPDYATDEDKLFAIYAYAAALAHISETYGIDTEYMDACADIPLAVLALARDLYDNRTMTVDKTHENPTVKAIMSCHDFNLL